MERKAPATRQLGKSALRPRVGRAPTLRCFASRGCVACTEEAPIFRFLAVGAVLRAPRRLRLSGISGGGALSLWWEGSNFQVSRELVLCCVH
jgi:hypothetical protein